MMTGLQRSRPPFPAGDTADLNPDTVVCAGTSLFGRRGREASGSTPIGIVARVGMANSGTEQHGVAWLHRNIRRGRMPDHMHLIYGQVILRFHEVNNQMLEQRGAGVHDAGNQVFLKRRFHPFNRFLGRGAVVGGDVFLSAVSAERFRNSRRYQTRPAPYYRRERDFDSGPLFPEPLRSMRRGEVLRYPEHTTCQARCGKWGGTERRRCSPLLLFRSYRAPACGVVDIMDSVSRQCLSVEWRWTSALARAGATASQAR